MPRLRRGRQGFRRVASFSANFASAFAAVLSTMGTSEKSSTRIRGGARVVTARLPAGVGLSIYVTLFTSRSVAQPGSAPRSGRGGRRFKSCHSDQPLRSQRLGYRLRSHDGSSRGPIGSRPTGSAASNSGCMAYGTQAGTCLRRGTALCWVRGARALVGRGPPDHPQPSHVA